MEQSYKLTGLDGGKRPGSGRPATEPTYLLGTYSAPILAASVDEWGTPAMLPPSIPDYIVVAIAFAGIVLAAYLTYGLFAF
jgi:hypothetical protein